VTVLEVGRRRHRPVPSSDERTVVRVCTSVSGAPATGGRSSASPCSSRPRRGRPRR
jgi:hypothetical protein